MRLHDGFIVRINDKANKKFGVYIPQGITTIRILFEDIISHLLISAESDTRVDSVSVNCWCDSSP